MTSDPDDALNWDGDETLADPAPALPQGWNAVGKGSETVGRIEEPTADAVTTDDTTARTTASDAPAGLSTAMLITLGVFGGIYLLYMIGWLIGGLNLQVSALFLIPSVMYQISLWAAVLAPALWFAGVWVLTRKSASWIRILALLAGVVLLVPWPFVMTGAGL